MPIDPAQLPDNAEVLRRMVLDLIAQFDAEQTRRKKTENLLRQLLAARSGRRSEQITDEQLALFEAELKAQGVNVQDLSKAGHFHNALENDQARMGGVLAMIAQLYAVEKTARRNGWCGEELRMARERDARPTLDRLHEYLVTIREQVLPKSEAGQAIAYTLKNWTALTRYCSDGDLSIDNNRTERSLRSFAVGRNYALATIMCSSLMPAAA